MHGISRDRDFGDDDDKFKDGACGEEVADETWPASFEESARDEDGVYREAG